MLVLWYGGKLVHEKEMNVGELTGKIMCLTFMYLIVFLYSHRRESVSNIFLLTS